MQPDPARAAETREWLAKAAAEKSLKGFLTWHNVVFRKTHSLEEIGEQCLQIDRTLRSLIDRAVPRTDYAWRFRYPGDLDEPPVTEAHQALVLAREVYEAVSAGCPKRLTTDPPCECFRPGDR